MVRIPAGKLGLASACATAVAVAVLVAVSGTSTRAQQIPSGYLAQNVEVVGYNDVDGNVPFKMAINSVQNRWYLYVGSFWVRGWSILDVTDPKASKVVKFIKGPDNTSTVQMDWAEGARMETPVSRILPGRDFDPNKSFDAGFYIWDLKNPLDPQRIGYWKSGGTHRNWYDGGRYVHATSAMEGYKGQIYVIVDVADPANPKEVGRWWYPGQHTAGGEKLEDDEIGLHGPPVPVGNLVYLPYKAGGFIVLDISDKSKPRKIGQLSVTPPFKGNEGVHTIVPIPERKIAIANSEAIDEKCEEGINFAGIVDIADPTKPTLLSLFPRPIPPPGLPYTDFCDKGGRFGPHNVNQLQHSQWVEKQTNLVYMTYFNAGLRIFDISNPRQPIEVGYFIPPDPVKRYGPLPATKLVIQTNDVLVDTRGYIYITDRNEGVWILRYTGKRKP